MKLFYSTAVATVLMAGTSLAMPYQASRGYLNETGPQMARAGDIHDTATDANYIVWNGGLDPTTAWVHKIPARDLQPVRGVDTARLAGNDIGGTPVTILTEPSAAQRRPPVQLVGQPGSEIIVAGPERSTAPQYLAKQGFTASRGADNLTGEQITALAPETA